MNRFQREKHLSISLLAVALVGCGPETPGEALAGDIRACEILPANEVARIFGKEVSSASPSMESTNGATASSQCSYRFGDSGLGLSVQIRRSGRLTEQSRQAEADAARAQNDSLGIGEDIAAAIEAGQDIADLGNVAYEFEESTYQQLVVYWDDHFQVVVLSYADVADREGMSRARKEAAQYVIDHL